MEDHAGGGEGHGDRNGPVEREARPRDVSERNAHSGLDLSVFCGAESGSTVNVAFVVFFLCLLSSYPSRLFGRSFCFLSSIALPAVRYAHHSPTPATFWYFSRNTAEKGRQVYDPSSTVLSLSLVSGI